MSGSFRSRRASSPPQSISQRFPRDKENHLDADERLNQAKLESRPFIKKSQTHAFGGIKMSLGEWQMLIVISLIAVAVRLFRLSQPDSVVFDEVHFGKFASKYIKTQYYVDVHPPLAKLLITLFAFVSGYDGNFDFKDIGKLYENVPYIAMRSLPAILGVALVPISYLTIRALECRPSTAVLGSLFITFENGLITQSRYILLDSPLVFFTGLTTFLWVAFCNENRHKPFTDAWWLLLTLSGLSLGAVLSCKWVGLFTVATVGFSTVRQLWLLLGDLKVSPRMWIRHFIARALCLIVVPLMFYMAMFEIHFLILENSGDGDGFMSSEFQHTLGGRHMVDTYADVALGSTITLRHANTQGGYLHSHPHNYPTGSKQQQITLYPHRDNNNDWLVLNTTAEGEEEFDWKNSPLEYITSGMQLKLEHNQSDKRLHSHDVRPPVSEVEFQNEVSAYGFEGFKGDANDYWIIEIFEGDDRDKESHKRLRTLRTKFRLRHLMTGCYLFSHKVKLPEWGFDQQEVTCNKNAPKDNSLWYVETNTHPQLPMDAPKVNYRLPGFLSKFLELQQVMWRTNAGLTERHNFDSRPSHWPRLRRGINFWVKDHKQIYLIGNPWVWWLSTGAIIAYIGVRALLILRAKRGYKDWNNSTLVRYDELCGFLFMGWGLHYFPFYLMTRQLFLHHYFPALYFAVLLFCAVFDLATADVKRKYRLQLVALVIGIAIWNYLHFASLAYGTPWTKSQCERSKWLRTWDFACHDFHDSYDQYGGIGAATSAATPVITIGGDEDGRPPMVIVDEAKQEEEPQADTTAVLNQPEPGPNIFHPPAPNDDVRSESVEVAQKMQEEHRATTATELDRTIEKAAPPPAQQPPHVASVIGGTADADADGVKEKENFPEQVATSSTHPDGAETGQAQENVAEATEEAPSNPKGGDVHDLPPAPMDQAEMERERVQKELYGDHDHHGN